MNAMSRRPPVSLDRLCIADGLPRPIAEYRFHPRRRWRFDWAWVSSLVAVEEDGAVWTGGRHTRGGGYLADIEKLNAAAELGWRVFRYETGCVDLAQLRRVLTQGSQ